MRALPPCLIPTGSTGLLCCIRTESTGLLYLYSVRGRGEGSLDCSIWAALILLGPLDCSIWAAVYLLGLLECCISTGSTA